MKRNQESDQAKADTPQKYRSPRSIGKGKDMPEDHEGHRTDPEEDYERPDGSERRGLGGP